MATLEKIDRIKTELQTAKQGLHEADNWTVLANDVEEVNASRFYFSIIKLNAQTVAGETRVYPRDVTTGIRVGRH